MPSQLYGPPPHPRQVHVDLEMLNHPELYALCLGVGLAVSLLAMVKRWPPALRAWCFISGQVLMLTAPLGAVFTRHVFGAYPTIDKSGSLLFYLEGVHRTVTFHPIEALSDPAARLIGVHVGHLWVTAFFDLFLEPFAAFNVQGLLYPALGWWCAALLLREFSESWRVAVVLAWPFGMGLHVFRDLNWYTIEKASVFALALLAWALVKAWKSGGRWTWVTGLVYVGAAFLNWYWALVGAAGAALVLAVTRSRDVAKACAWSAGLALPLVAYQYALLSGPGTLGDPETFLNERASQDVFSLVPLAWNRLEVHRAVNMVVAGLAFFGALAGLRVRFVQGVLAVASGLFLLSLGPYLVHEVQNPVYMLLHTVMPGFWRVAKPEVFFEGTYLCLLVLAAWQVRGRRIEAAWFYPLWVPAWLILVRTHPAYPEFSEFVEMHLADDWAERRGLVPEMTAPP